MTEKTDRQLLIIGVVFGTLAAAAWAGGFVVAKHGIEIGFAPADLAFHRFFWTSLFLLPFAYREGLRDLGGLGWGRGLIVSLLSGPTQALIAYTGFILVPLGHGTTIQPACAALSGLILATLVLREPLSSRRALGGTAIIVGLMIYGWESLSTIGVHGVGGDLMFVLAGVGWATFGMLVRLWHLPGMRAIVIVGFLSIVVYLPVYLFFYDPRHLLAFGLYENLLQAVVQGLIAGVLPIYLYTHAVFALGAGRAATFPALVPIFGLVMGFIALGVVPSWAQLIGLVVVVIGFRLTVR